MEGAVQLSLELNSDPVLATIEQEAEHNLLRYNAV
jgi:hypothetical protein